MKDTSKEELKALAEECNSIPLQVNDKYYLINSHWYRIWADFIGLSKTYDDTHGHNHPGVIDNRSLLTQHNSMLKSDLIEDTDFKIIHEKLWNRLKEEYGVSSELDTIERKVINDSISGGMDNLKVEVYLQNVKITNMLDGEHEIRTLSLSRQAKLSDVAVLLKVEYDIEVSRDVRLYMKLSGVNSSLIENFEKKTLADSEYAMVDVLGILARNKDGTWPSVAQESFIGPKIPDAPPALMGQYPPVSATASSLSPMITRSNASKIYNDTSFSNRYNSEFKAGLCGLNNLGNTCFMNSAIQCMSNVPLLTEYFVENKYKSEINLVNPLGQKGELAIAYADLVKEMWSGQTSYTSPRQLKLHISRFAPQFIGFQQQDSQELLSFLLDGLHEDLNRIMKKPYIEQNDDDTKTDEELSKETWENYLKRNNSIITDLFHGLVKSTLNCLECNKISIKFDPMCYLSLPLPSKKERLIEITYVSLDIKQALTKYKLTVLKNGTINDLCNALAQHTGVARQYMAVCDVYNSKIFHLFEPSESVSNIRERDEIYIYQLAANFNSPDHFKFNFYLKSKSSYMYSQSYFGLPLVFSIPKNEINASNVFERCNQGIRRLIGEADDLNFGDTLNDEIDKKLNVNDETSDKHQKQAVQQKYFFKLTLSKADQYEPSDSPQIDDHILLQQLTNVAHTYSIVAECPTKLKDHLQDNKFMRNVVEHESCNTKLINKRDVLTLDDCLNLYTKKEELGDSDLWYCPKCKEHRHATKQMDLWTLPPVLIINLKRFSYSRTYRDKIDTLVEFPIRGLNFSNFARSNKKENCYKYNLIAVSNHYGGLGGGHYTAYGQNRYDGRWYNFDDSSVSSSDEASVITPAAYLLVYLREDLHATYVPAAATSSYSSSTTTDNHMEVN